VHTFSVGVLGNLFSRVGSGGMPYLIPLMMQVALGYSPVHAGMMMIPAALAGMFSKRIVVPLVRVLGYRRVLVGNTVLVGLVMASFALVRPGLPVWVHIVQFACFGAVNSLQFTAMNTLASRDSERLPLELCLYRARHADVGRHLCTTGTHARYSAGDGSRS
jgi:hypothetical protein